MQKSSKQKQFHNASSKNFSKNLVKKFAFCFFGGTVNGKERKNSVRSGSCHRQFGSNSHYSILRLVDDCTRKDQCATSDVFLTSTSLFFCLRKNRLKKINNYFWVTLSEGGYNAHRQNEHLKDAVPHPVYSRTIAFPLQVINVFAHAPVS